MAGGGRWARAGGKGGAGLAELFAGDGVERAQGEEGEGGAEEEQVGRGHGQTMPRGGRRG